MLSLTQWLVCLTSLVMSTRTELCNRLYLGGLDENYVAFVQLGGVYKLTDQRWHDFPVLESESSPGDYFYFNREVNHFFVGRDNGSSLGLGATARGGSVPRAPTPDHDSTWISTFHDQPYRDVLGHWFQFDYVNKANVLIQNGTFFNTSQIGLHCVQSEVLMRPCASGKLIIAQPITWHDRISGTVVEVNVPGEHAWEVVPGVYQALRPVYRRVDRAPGAGSTSGSPTTAYLYHDSFLFGTWNLGTDYTQRGVYAYVRDTALSPEYITGQWFIKHHKEPAQALSPISGLGLQCLGIEGSGCSDSLCENGGTCLDLPGHDEIWCQCAEGYTGTTCQQELPSCARIEGAVFPPNTHTALWDGLHAGALATFTCREGFSPQFFYSRCVQAPSSAEWQHYGACALTTTIRRTTPTTPAPRTTRNYDNDDDDRREPWDEPVWLYPVVLTGLIFLEVCGPVCVWAFCLSRHGFLRISSALYSALFWIYAAFLPTCGASQCGFYSESLDFAVTVALISMPIMYVVILIETVRSSENQYISKLGETDTVSKTIQILRRTQPGVVWMVQCYHYETRTRTVYYTDSNGNQQSRIETYQQMVVTHTEVEVFEFACWLDDSAGAVERIERYRITRIKLDKSVQPGDEATRTEWNRRRTNLQDRNRHKDVHMSFSEEHVIPGFEKRLAAYVDESANSWWVGKLPFWVAALLCLTWPYRWLFKYKSGKTFYTVSKKLYLNTPEVSGGNDVMMYCTDAAQHPPTDSADGHTDSDMNDVKEKSDKTNRLTTIPV